MKWRVILERDPETEDRAVWCPELPGCTSAGITEDEALENIREAIELYLKPSPSPYSLSSCQGSRGSASSCVADGNCPFFSDASGS